MPAPPSQSQLLGAGSAALGVVRGAYAAVRGEALEWTRLLTLALAARALVAFVLLGSMPMVHDAASYAELAGQLLWRFPGDQAYYWPPGNSLLLAAAFRALGESVAVARATTIVVSLLGVVFTALIARRLTTSARARRITGYLAALYAPAVMLAAQSYSQHLAALCMVACAYFALRSAEELRAPSFVAAGACFGIGVITRPSMLSLAPFLLALFGAAVVRAKGRQLRALACVASFGAATAAFVAPVIAHNYARGAGPVVSTNNERNLLLGNNPYTPDYKTSHLGQRDIRELAPEVRAYLQGFYARPDARSAMQSAAIDYMVSHPAKTAVRTVNRATSFWGFDYLASRVIQEHRGWGTGALLAMLTLEAGAYALVMLLAIVGAFALPEASAPRWRRWLLLFALAYELPYMIAFSGGTYHFPVVGLLLPLAAIAAAHAFQRGGARRLFDRLRERKLAAALVVAFVLVQAQYAYHTLAMQA